MPAATPAAQAAAPVAQNVTPGTAVVEQGFSPAVVRHSLPVAGQATTSATTAEAIFSAADIRAFRHLTALADQGVPDLESLLAPLQDPTPIAEIERDPIVIAPITIKALASDTQ
jgi:hypothetical protein